MSKWPNKLTIIRHGESEQNVALESKVKELIKEQKQIRDADIKLTKKGILQAIQTGKYLATQEKYDFCYISPYQRTTQTAENIIQQLPYKLQIRNDFRLIEKEFGLIHGYTKEEVKEFFPYEYNRKNLEGKFYFRPAGGENYPDVMRRVHNFLDKLHRDHEDENILIVTHQVPYLIFRSLFEYLNEKQILELGDVPNCGIEEFIQKNNNLKLKKFNETHY